MSGQEPRIGPNMFLPRIQAPTFLKPRAAKSSSIPVVPPSAPNKVRWNVRVGTDLHQWLVPTRTFQRTLFGADGGTTGIDDDFAARGFKNVGAWILGRNMFGPFRGSWSDMNWKGWWGDNPPYHVPTFILTHHARPPIQMEGETTFYFVTGGIHEALDRARDAANGMDVRIGGGPNTIRQYLRAGLLNELHVAISPVLLGGGERLFEGIDMRALG